MSMGTFVLELQRLGNRAGHLDEAKDRVHNGIHCSHDIEGRWCMRCGHLAELEKDLARELDEIVPAWLWAAVYAIRPIDTYRTRRNIKELLTLIEREAGNVQPG